MKLPHLLVPLTVLGLLSVQAELRLNEFLASNTNTLATEGGEYVDWLEIYNSGNESINLEGYFLTDKEAFSPDDAETFWRFPGISLAPDAYLIVFASGRDGEFSGEWHTNFRISRGGERLALIAPDGITVITDLNPNFPEQEPNISYGYVADEDVWEFMPQPSPGAPNRFGVSGFVDEVQFSVEHGFYDEPFMLTLSTETEGAEICYTLSDAEPDDGTIFTGPTGETYDGPIEISKTTVVRAVAKKKGFRDSVLRTRSYLFLRDVIHQPRSPEGFPAKWGSRNPDYGMDPDVVGPIYSEEEVIAALKSAPTISLVTENDNLFSRNGIYTNSQAKDNTNDGIHDLWERPVSIEMFGFPHGQTIQANAGIRMQGNASRSPNRVKHNMRVIFRSHYGPSKLRFRLFEDSEVENYNSLNLRSNNGDSWIHPGVRVRAQYIRDQWHREVQRRMGMPHQTQIYAHVYINGLYWGMYHVFERFEASLLSEHFGGDEDDWDALQDTAQFQDIVVNGTKDAYLRTHALAKEDLTVEANYNELLKYVDVDNQIDYLLINYYSGNQDWDHKNMRYGRRIEPVEGALGNGWMYFAWDSERAGLNGLNTQSLTMDNTGNRTKDGPSLLNVEMHENPEYHLRFADRVVRHLFNGGELTPEGTSKSWNDLADIVYEPLIGESARWGDLHANTPETREGNWQRQLDKENEDWFPHRTDVLLDQLADRGFIPRRISFPQFSPHGGVVASGAEVTMQIFNHTVFNPVMGDIVYTTNGEDPRLSDGTLNPNAQPYDKSAPPVVNEAMKLMGRVYDANDGEWSPLGEADFFLAEPATVESLIISEIHHAPVDPTTEEEALDLEASSFEFIELLNRSDHAIDLSGLQLTRGVRATVPNAAGSVLEAGGHALIVADEEAFRLRYPESNVKHVVAEFEEGTRLDNAGERLSIRDYKGVLLHTVRYADKEPWPSLENGAGQSLVYLSGPGSSLADPDRWAEGVVGGTPGVAEGDQPSGGGDGEGGLADWLNDYGLADAMTAPLGLGRAPALLYYAFGVDDLHRGEKRLSPSIHARDGSMVMAFERRSDVRDLEWQLESSRDLRVWEAVDVSFDVVWSDDHGQENVEVTLPSEQTYWRLRITVK